MPAGECRAGSSAWLTEVDGDNRIDGLAATRVVLAHADPARAAAVDDAVCEAPLAITRRRCRRERRRLALAGAEPIEAAIRKIREIEDAIRDGPGAAAVFVHARSHIERWRHDVGRTGCIGAHHDVAALLLRARFQPVQDLAVEAHLRQPDRL